MISLTPSPRHVYHDGIFTYRRIVTRDECPHFKTAEAERMRRMLEDKYGKNSAFIQSMIYGRFVNALSEDAIFNDQDIERMKRAMRPGESNPLGGDIRAAADPSGGGDKMVMMIRAGTEIVWVNDNMTYLNDLDAADKWVEHLRALNIEPWQFWMDGAGSGATIANYMEQRLGYLGINRIQPNCNPTIDFEFKDRYTEIHWWVKELLAYNVLKVPHCEKLIEDMRSRLFVVTGVDSKPKTEPKPKHRERTGRSPDFLDCLCYLFYDFPMESVRMGEVAKPVGQDKKRGLTLLEQSRRAMASTTNTELFAGLPKMPDMAAMMKGRFTS